MGRLAEEQGHYLMGGGTSRRGKSPPGDTVQLCVFQQHLSTRTLSPNGSLLLKRPHLKTCVVLNVGLVEVVCLPAKCQVEISAGRVYLVNPPNLLERSPLTAPDNRLTSHKHLRPEPLRAKHAADEMIQERTALASSSWMVS
ncbi:unnamed protein product [Lota lota]